MSAPLNQCSVCNEDFSSLELFDRHITSAPADPTPSCLSVHEMTEKSWQKDARGRWVDPVRAERARNAFAKARTALA